LRLEKLGLKLEKSKAPTERLAVDRAEKESCGELDRPIDFEHGNCFTTVRKFLRARLNAERLGCDLCIERIDIGNVDRARYEWLALRCQAGDPGAFEGQKNLLD
jgi:hypothetical protein